MKRRKILLNKGAKSPAEEHRRQSPILTVSDIAPDTNRCRVTVGTPPALSSAPCHARPPALMRQDDRQAQASMVPAVKVARAAWWTASMRSKDAPCSVARRSLQTPPRQAKPAILQPVQPVPPPSGAHPPLTVWKLATQHHHHPAVGRSSWQGEGKLKLFFFCPKPTLMSEISYFLLCINDKKMF